MSIYEIPFYKWEQETPDSIFLRQPFGPTWETYTWSQTMDQARRMCSYLKSLGLREKSHISIISKNCREWIIADMAIMMAGYISVPFYPTLTGEQLGQVIELGDVDAIFVGKVESWEDMQRGIPEDMPIIAFPHYEGCSQVDRGVEWHDILATHSPFTGVYHPALEDIWTIVFTSGTTGTPKGVVLPYSIINSTKQVAQQNNSLQIDFDGDNQFFSYLPLNHIAERVIVETNALTYGGTISFVESLETFNANLKDTRPTVFFAVPRIWTKFQMAVLSKMPQEQLDAALANEQMAPIVKQQIKSSLGLDRSRVNMSGAAPISQSTKEWYLKLGIPISEGYGMTENCAICTTIKPEVNKPGSVGIPQTNAEIKIDPDTKEILMRAPYVMAGYYKDPEKTAETIRDGWLHTGDQGYIDEDGYLFITGRIKDTFKTAKGKFIIPAPLEWHFALNSDIEQICIAGIGCPQPIALVVLSEMGVTKNKTDLAHSLETMLESINSELPNYQKISTIVCMDEPWSVDNGLLTPTLKVKRNVIDQRYRERYEHWHHAPGVVIFHETISA